MKELFLDIETTGIPPKNADWDLDYKLFPYIVSMAWIHENQAYEVILNQEGRTIPEETVRIHKITDEIAAQSPYKFREAVQMLVKHCSEAEVIVGHNLYFDISIVKANIMREFSQLPEFAESREYVMSAFAKEKRVDTMMKSVAYCNIKKEGSNRAKWPTLSELYNKLFGETFTAHNAKEDILACRRCYYELKKLAII